MFGAQPLSLEQEARQPSAITMTVLSGSQLVRVQRRSEYEHVGSVSGTSAPFR